MPTRWRVLAVAALAVACDKEAIYENVKPFDAAAGGPAAPTFDGGFRLDAGALAGDAGLISEQPVTFSKAGLLRSLADCAIGRYRAFASATQDLAAKTRAYAQTLDPASRAAARDAFLATLYGWQELELFRFGPAGSTGEPGGKDLRNQIYFFPFVNHCLIDTTLLGRGYEATPLTLGVSAKGLGALDYLLFYEGEAGSCTTPLAGWDALDEGERARRRASYASVVAADLTTQAAALLAAWEPGQGDYYTQFTRAGAGSVLFARDQDAFNIVDNALYYFDRELKDEKVGLPLGINPNCMAETCPAAVESRFSFASNDNVIANIVGFRLIAEGCGPGYTGLGFDDWLRDAQHADLADRLRGAANAAEQAARGLPVPLELLLTQNRPQVQGLYDALKGVSDLLKAELPSALNLEPPMSVAGDND